MADSSPPRRVLPARERRESAAKRMASSPPPTPAPPPKKPAPTKGGPGSRGPRGPYKKRAPVIDRVQSPAHQPSSPIVPIDESAGLPVKVNDNQPLPTSDEPQPEKLSASEYQSIADSAVIAASLHRSRTKWLLEGLFDRYWTKPSKKKGAPELHNPEMKSMQKLGLCTVTIEPHTFEAMLYTVREPHPPIYRPPPFPHSGPALPGYPPYYGTPPNNPPRPPVPPSVAKSATPQSGPPAASPQVNSATRPTPAATTGGRAAGAASSPNTLPKQESSASSPSGGTSRSSIQRPDSGTPSKGNPDPVIQALATRAATDPALKDLMKHVATSQATQEQLRKFQEHIDELNAIIKNKREVEKDKQGEPAPTPNNAANTPSQPTPTTAPKIEDPPSRTSTPSNPPASANPTPPPSTIPPPGPSRPGLGPGPYVPYPPRPPSHYPPYPPPFSPPKLEPRVKHMIIEFTSPLTSTTAASPDRFHLPEYCVLEFLPPPTPGPPIEMLCSFLVVRSGSWVLERGGDPKFYKKGEEYFESVTMRVKAANPRTLETWGKSARTLRECREWMENVIRTKRRGKQGFLVVRLPKETEGSSGGGGGGEGEVATRRLEREREKDKDKEGQENGDTGASAGMESETVKVEAADEDDELRDRYDVPYIQ